MQQPIVCFDLDGTLVDSNGDIHPNDIALLEVPEPPVRFIPATGRSLDSVRSTFVRNGLFTDMVIPFPLVLQNGALLYAANEKRLDFFPFETRVQSELIQLALESPELTFLFLGEDEIDLLWEHPFGLDAASQYNFTVQPFTNHSRSKKFGKLMCISPSAAVLQDFEVRAASLPIHGAYSLADIYEINSPQVNKWHCLRTLLSRMGWQDQPVFAAGDGENDAELLAEAYRSFVPVTAPQSIQDLASFRVDVRKTGLLEPMIFASLQVNYN